MCQHQQELLLIHRHSPRERLVSESLGITEQPNQQLQGHPGSKPEGGTLARRRLNPRGVDHPLPSLPHQSFLRVVTSLFLPAFVLITMLLEPLTGPA